LRVCRTSDPTVYCRDDNSRRTVQNVPADSCARHSVLLWHVACEFLSASRKLNKQGFTAAHAWKRLSEFRDLLRLVLPTDANLTRARELHVVRGTPLWDALILAACVEAGVEILYSEICPDSTNSRVSASSIRSSRAGAGARTVTTMAAMARAHRRTFTGRSTGFICLKVLPPSQATPTPRSLLPTGEPSRLFTPLRRQRLDVV
jgi:predicted nucleic acid-binding protein